MVIGDMRKFLTCLVTLREDQPGNGKLDKLSQNFFSNRGIELKTIKEARESPKVKKIIMDGIKKAN